MGYHITFRSREINPTFCSGMGGGGGSVSLNDNTTIILLAKE